MEPIVDPWFEVVVRMLFSSKDKALLCLLTD